MLECDVMGVDAARGFDFMHFLASISGWGRAVVIQ